MIGIYPEYRKIVESSIAAQFSDASIEIMDRKPKFFTKKYYDITVMETVKNPVFPIKTFKQMPDDPINNVIDAMGKMANDDTFSIVMPIKPIGVKFNKTAKKWATGLYRKDNFYVKGGSHLWKWFFPPYWIIAFFIFLAKGNKSRK